MEHHPPKRSGLSPDARRWVVVGVFTGAMLLGLPLFPMIWKALAGEFPVFLQMATVLFLPAGLLALIVGIRKVAGWVVRCMNDCPGKKDRYFRKRNPNQI